MVFGFLVYLRPGLVASRLPHCLAMPCGSLHGCLASASLRLGSPLPRCLAASLLNGFGCFVVSLYPCGFAFRLPCTLTASRLIASFICYFVSRFPTALLCLAESLFSCGETSLPCHGGFAASLYPPCLPEFGLQLTNNDCTLGLYIDWIDGQHAQVQEQLNLLAPGKIGDVLKNVIPSFHVNRHEWGCLLLHSPTKFVGIIAHEFAEQLFSHFHRLGFRTRQMGNARRKDYITSYLMKHNWNVSGDKMLASLSITA